MTHQNSDVRPTAWSRPAVVAVAATGLLAAWGCNETAPEPQAGTTGTYTASLTRFESCEALDDYLADMLTETAVQNYAYGYGYIDVVAGGRDWAMDGAEGDAGGTPTGAPEPPSAPEEYTGTNVQEVGVDEADMVKTNGDTLFVINGQTLHIVDSWPAEEANELATFELPGWGEQMFLAGDRVVVFSSIYTGGSPYEGDGREPVDVSEPKPDEGFSGADAGADAPSDALPPDEGWTEPEPDPLDDGAWFSGTRVTVIDVSDPAAPTQAAVFDIEGGYVSSRMVDGIVYLVSRSDLFGYYDPALMALYDEVDIPSLDWEATEAERDAAADSLRAQIRPLLAAYLADGGRDRILPDVRTTAEDRANLLACSDLMYPDAEAGTAILSVLAFDPAAPDVSGVGLLADGWQVYGSQHSLYVAQDSRWWFWWRAEDAFAATHVHKFALNGGDPVYQASGEVPGWLLNQFSMSELDGHLRVATTDSTSFGWGGVVGGPAVDGDTVGVDAGTGSTEVDPAPSAGGGSASGSADKAVVDLRDDTTVDANNVFVLEQNGGALEIIGGLRGIAPTEQIYAVRFVGDTGYVITFRQTDPLFVVDLSDPANPVLRGELHVPGYSGYLHPFGDDHLIGIGRDGDEDGRIRGLQLSVFDVSDPDAPVRSAVHTLEYGDGSYSWSEAEHDHHAFTFYASRGLLAIPVTLEDWSYEDDTYSHFSGIVVFEVTADAITEVGRVSHTMMAAERYCGDIDTTDPEPVEACSSWDYPWWVQMRRSVFMDDYLFAISDMGVTSSAIEGLSEVLAEVRF